MDHMRSFYMLVFLSVVGMYQIYSGCWKYFFGLLQQPKKFRHRTTTYTVNTASQVKQYIYIYIYTFFILKRQSFFLCLLNSHSSPFSDWYLHHASWHFTRKNNSSQRCEELFVEELNLSSWLAFESESESSTDVPLYQCIHVLLIESIWLLCYLYPPSLLHCSL